VKFFLRAVLPGLILAGVSHAADRLPLAADLAAERPLFPALVEFAGTHKISLHGIEFAGEAAVPRTGDGVTLLVTLQRGESAQQWLVTLTAEDLTDAERAMKSPGESVIFTSTGLELRFPNSRAALEVYLAGPFVSAGLEKRPAVVETRTRALVNGQFLTRGLDRFTRSALEVGDRMRAARVDDFVYGTQGQPYSEPLLKIGRHWAERFKLTPEEERWANEAYFAMIAFFEAARKIGPLDELAHEVLETPSMWSIGRHFGVTSWIAFRWPDVEVVDGKHAPVAAPAYTFPLKIGFNEILGARATIVVTAPRPPLQVCGGILAIGAEHARDASRRLFIRLIAARPAP
jgi:hypothetical protein